MANDGQLDGELRAHAQSYSLFSGLMKWGTIISFVVAAIVVLIIAS